MPPKPTKPIKGTILVLHGFAQNGAGFAIKASGIRKAFKKVGYHTVFIDGPIKLTPADMPFEVKTNGTPFEDLNMRGWTYTQPERFDIQPSLESVRAAYKEYGPFVGLVGFSQGSGVVGAILSKFNEVVDDEKASDCLKFSMIYSGFLYDNKSVKKYYDEKIKLPTLHIMGELDTVVSTERSLALVNQCENATIMKHPGGHYVPSTKDLVRREIAWVEEVMNGEKDRKDPNDSKEPKEFKEPKDLKKITAEKEEKEKRELDELSKKMARLGKA
ncbi:hypothetical protein FOA43_001865 [Brettanomyces nanus]|uniref:Serine hydrolase domain-containing protein n=1 Tax=Eeniella nana TaxID=13502 RepID=A0A875S2H2_EENNA|nr:uncharacterized protein FOA43_001865 [Brettanomyces nanus]QPG74535.1 hypothetical protein FOA43_001865 [Brettanomyces nanus]